MQEGREDERDLKEQQRQTEGWSPRKKGRGCKQKEIPGVGDVICSSCTRQESVICSTKAADFIRQNRAGQGRAGQLSGLYLLNRDIPESK